MNQSKSDRQIASNPSISKITVRQKPDEIILNRSCAEMLVRKIDVFETTSHHITINYDPIMFILLWGHNKGGNKHAKINNKI